MWGLPGIPLQTENPIIQRHFTLFSSKATVEGRQLLKAQTQAESCACILTMLALEDGHCWVWKDLFLMPQSPSKALVGQTAMTS